MCVLFFRLGVWSFFQAQAPGIDPEEPYLSAEDLADQVAEVAQHFRLTDVTCLGVSAGSYILSLLAIRHRHLVKGLILVSPVCRAPSWVEWARNGLLMATLSYCGMARHVKDFLLERYFCQDQHGYHGPGSDSLLSFRRELDERDPESVMRYMSAMHQRKDLTRSLADALIKAQCLVVVGALSPFLDEAEHIVKQLDPQRTHFLKVRLFASYFHVPCPLFLHLLLQEATYLTAGTMTKVCSHRGATVVLPGGGMRIISHRGAAAGHARVPLLLLQEAPAAGLLG